MRDLGIESGRIVIVGQSLGTAVASAVALHFTSPVQRMEGLLPAKKLSSPKLKAAETPSTPAQGNKEATFFASVILIAPFASLPSLLKTYRIGGIFPILGPALYVPGLGDWLGGRVVDTWRSAERLENYQRRLGLDAELLTADRAPTGKGLLQILHASDDRDIDFRQSVEICRGLAGRAACKVLEDGRPQVLHSGGEDMARTRIEILEFGGMCFFCL